MFRIFTALIIVLLSIPATAKPESWYINRYCRQKLKGIPEYTLPSQRRVDCLTDTHALEFGFLTSPYQDIGQALYYANETGRQPGIVWIIRNNKDYKTIEEMRTTCKRYKINVQIIRAKRLKIRF